MKQTDKDQAMRWGVIAFLVIGALSVSGAFYAPCGCYAGTPVKDVPLRCVETGR